MSAFGLGVALFAATNIDDLLVLIAFFADPRYGAAQVVAGQCLGIAALVAASLVAASVSLVLPDDAVGMLGFLPIAVGLK